MIVLQHPDQHVLDNALAHAVREILVSELTISRAGRCLRVGTLPETVMRTLCADLSTDTALDADVVLLVGPREQATAPWQISATRLIELRNAEARPLLAFVPPGLKVAAEDSFDISTFVEVDLSGVPAQMRRQLRAQLPEKIADLTDRALHYLEKVERRITDDDVVSYYLTLIHNDVTQAAAGGALYQLGLIPDFALLDVQDRINQRLDRNCTALRTLAESLQPLLGRILELQLEPDTLQTALYDFFQGRSLTQVREWGRALATDPSLRPLSFEHWRFVGEQADRENLLLIADDLNLPPRDQDQPIGADNPLYLDVNRSRTVRIKWSTQPKPSVAPNLAHFRIEIVSADNGAVAWESKNIRVSRSTRAYRSKSLKTTEFRYAIEDGLYFFRIRAYSPSGDIINEEDAEANPEILRDPRNPEGKRQNETDDVWFWKDEDVPPPAEPKRNVTVQSFVEAQQMARFAALDRGQDPLDGQLVPRDRTGWATAKGKRAEALYHIVYDAQVRFTLAVSTLLRQIESDTLAHPETLGRWRLNFASGEPRESVTPSLRQFRDTGQIPAEFLQARSDLFQALHQGEQDQLTSTIDLLGHENAILTYAAAYEDWLAQVQADFTGLAIREEAGRRRTVPIFLDLDTVEVLLPNDVAGQERVYLIAPTHPLRLLWHLQWARMARDWLAEAAREGDPKMRLPDTVRSYLRRGLAPVNLPPLLRVAHDTPSDGISRFYVEQGPLTPFWSLYVREDARDGWALRSRVLRLLGIGRQSVSVSAAGGLDQEALTQKLLRYLMQHPYVSTLKVNVFNPGDAGLVVDAILGVEGQRNKARLAPLRYELRLFARAADLDDVGQAVEELLNPEHQVSPEADAFTVASQNHLFPKLRFSRNRLDDFVRRPERYEAHLSILHDLFPVGVDLRDEVEGRSSFVHGLIQEQVTSYTGDETLYAWQRQLLARPCAELPGDGPAISERLGTLLNQIGNLQASVAAGKKVETVVPTLHLRLDDEDKRLLYEVHTVSDWVFIIDRHLGLEYFDGEAPQDRALYLLDFTPEFAGADAERLLLTTRSVDEVTRLIRPVLEEYGLLAAEGVEVYFLNLLRSLSGRLALKLLSAPNSVREALGLALARLFLEKYGLLVDRIVLPLDAHSALFAAAGQEAAWQDEVALQRGDLLLVSCDPAERRLHFHIIEVKWRSELNDLSAYLSLCRDVEGQITQSEDALRQHFDPHLRPVDRIDRPVKIKELISLLSFYMERSRRYGLLSDEAAATLRPFIESLDEGYTLTCAGAGLIFEFSGEGLESHEEHAGLVFHRVGNDIIRRLLDHGLRRKALLRDRPKPTTIEETIEDREARERITRDTSMSGDPSYRRVRTHFGETEGLEEKDVIIDGEPVEDEQPAADAESPEADVKPDVPLSQASEPAIEPPTPEVEQPASVIEPASIESSPQPSITPTPPPVPPVIAPTYDILLGETGTSPQYGILGKAAGRIVALDLSGTNTISLFGVQGAGKSYTVGSVVEMATKAFPGVNLLPAPLATVIFHYHESQDYPPEFVSMNAPNTRESEIRALEQEYGAQPDRLEDVLILTSADKVAARQAEFPSVQVEPLYFSSTELALKDWRFLMGAFGTQMYMKQIALIMRQLRDKMTLATLREEIEASELSDGQKTIARIRLNFAAQFVDDSRRLAEKLYPGRLVIVDLRDEFIEKDEALGLFVVMLNIFANAGRDGEGHPYNKLIVFDEAHKYMDDPNLTGHIVDVIRQMRHQGVSVLIASQDPPSLPNAIIELSSLVILHRFNSPAWLKHIQRSITALADLTPAQMVALAPGEAYVWATKATERVFAQKAVKMRFRPRVTRHGGETRRVGEK
jgi:DNA phosphorothioation-dependent restriction protein DptH